MDLKAKKYSDVQLAGIILVVVFAIFTETSLFKDMPDLWRAGAIITFAIIGTVLGVKRGGIKEILEETKKILESSEETEEVVEQIENYMHLLAVKAGILWSRLGIVVQTRLGKILEKKKLKEEKKAIEKPEIKTIPEKVEVIIEKKEVDLNPIL